MTASDGDGSEAQLLADTCGFLSHERDDVRKMALHTLAQMSKDNATLCGLLASSSSPSSSSTLQTLVLRMHVSERASLGDVLTVFVNCAGDAACAEAMVRCGVVRRAMRLLSELEMTELPASYVRGMQEMTLMLLNNLTASHVSAIDELLQRHDADMRGFYLGKLQTLYSRLGSNTHEDDEEDKKDEDDTRAKDGAAAATTAAAAAPPHRDVRKWVLHILLNLTRTRDGQELLLEDDDWRQTLCARLHAREAPAHRLLVAQCYRNCACAQTPLYALLLKGDVLTHLVDQLAGKEPVPAIQQCLAECVAFLTASEEAMAQLDGMNAKQLLTRAMASTTEQQQQQHSSSDDTQMPPSSASSSSSAVCLAPEVCTFLQQHVLPYLDDVVDAYLAPGSEELD